MVVLRDNCLESEVMLTEAQRDAIKKHQDRVKALCKDLDVCSMVSATETGEFRHTTATYLGDEVDIKKEIKSLESKHAEFLKHVDSWIEEDRIPANKPSEPSEDDDADEEDNREQDPMSVLAEKIHGLVPEEWRFSLVLMSPEKTCVSGTLMPGLAAASLLKII